MRERGPTEFYTFPLRGAFPISKRVFQIALAKVRRNSTVFSAPHRLSTIRNANKILVVDRGRIAELGTHQELCRKNGIYKKLYDLQFPEEKEEVF